jgi:hypothetical protein
MSQALVASHACNPILRRQKVGGWQFEVSWGK